MTYTMRFGIVGYSTRALVQAVVDLGHRAVAIDAFGDQDTLELADAVHVVDDWPIGIMDAALLTNVDAWLLGGGMENCEEWLANGYANANASRRTGTGGSLAELAPVLGAERDEMRTLRSPEFWASLSGDGVHWPITALERPQGDLSQWLFKPRRSAGGLSVRHADSVPCDSCADGYWQQRIEGRVLGVSWIFDDHQCQLLGVTESLGPQDWSGPSEFIYRGSMGPMPLGEFQAIALLALGQRVHAALPDYRGYLQADLIEDADNELWLVEFNPRWTAGMEVLHEYASEPAQSPLGRHLQAWGIAATPGLSWLKPATRLVSKAIYYSPADFELPQATRRKLQSLRSWQSSSRPGWEWCVADLPTVAPIAPMRFVSGSPILTVKSRQLT